MIACAFHRVPPDPQVMAQLHAEYLRCRGKRKLSFAKYLRKIGFTDPAAGLKGADRGSRPPPRPGMERVLVPARAVTGTLRLLVLLADFPDNKGLRAAREFEDMLFSNGTFQTGSMRDFYAEVSCGKVEVVGSVHGWLRMPHKYSYYVGTNSGMGAFPHNAQKLAADALAAAIKKKVPFGADLDKFGDGSVTALFVVHAGRGAEALSTVAAQKKAIWSHKADLNTPYRITGTLSANNYLTVPEDCRMGVCAHELGHLAFGWDDFYDPNYAEDGSQWDGSGVWDLMAGGSWNNGGLTPAHPAGLHKSQHPWLTLQDLSASRSGVVIPPYSKTSGTAVRVKGKDFSNTQWLIIENRRRTGFDRALPGEGLLVWRVDTKAEQVNATEPAMLLVQADGRHDLENPNDSDAGDPGDPFPGSSMRHELGDTGPVSTSFPGQQRSGVSLRNITLDTRGNARFDVIFA